MLSWLLGALLEYVAIALGVVGFLCILVANFAPKTMPALSVMWMRIAGAVFFCTSMYLTGSITAEKRWAEEVRLAAERERAAQAAAEVAAQQVQAALEAKVQVITKTKVVIRDRIDQNASTIDGGCRIPPVAVDILNQAARSPNENKNSQ